MFTNSTRYIDKWIYHCDWYPDTKLRLWKKEMGRWGRSKPTRYRHYETRFKSYQNNWKFKHILDNSIAEHIEQTNKFTSIAAKAAHTNGVRSTLF